MQVVRIVQSEGDGPKRGFGTKVVLPSGEEMPNIYSAKVECAGPDELWVADIRCMVNADELEVLAKVRNTRLAWWRKALAKLVLVGL